MNKDELIHAVALRSGATKKTTSELLDIALECIVSIVAAGENVTLAGFGAFKPRKRAQRNGRNPQTGEAMVIPAAVVPGFSPGKAFKDRVKS
jgi:DNA-binding protein HU-beta